MPKSCCFMLFYFFSLRDKISCLAELNMEKDL